MRRVISAEKLAETLRAANLDVSFISLEKAIKYYKKARELEWKRSTT
jgi:predicted rRNA methylase YqxC with S4 and FtsJ domains